MRRLLVLLFIVALFVIITVSDGSALTFELNKDKPGVQAFIQKNLRFTVGGAPIIQKLPANFYVIYYSPDDIPVPRHCDHRVLEPELAIAALPRPQLFFFIEYHAGNSLGSSYVIMDKALVL